MLRSYTLLSLLFFQCFVTHFLNGQSSSKKMDGITLVAPPQPIGQEQMNAVSSTGAGWVALVPYAFQRENEAKVSGGLENKWWGENKDGISQCISMAKKANLKVMLKPQVWIRQGWVGGVQYSKESDWKTWEDSYTEYIMSNAILAEANGVDLFCIGTEYDLIAIQRDAYWRGLIKSIRKVYSGQLTYSANWDKYDDILFWDDLDYIGISAYFPLTDLKTPPANYVASKWKKLSGKFASMSKKYNKKILFTEYGYLSVDNCADKTWELEANLDAIPVNEECQANALEGLYQSLWDKDYMAGGFLWKWFSYPSRREGNRAKEYDPQGKKGLSILSKYYKNF